MAVNNWHGVLLLLVWEGSGLIYPIYSIFLPHPLLHHFQFQDKKLLAGGYLRVKAVAIHDCIYLFLMSIQKMRLNHINENCSI